VILQIPTPVGLGLFFIFHPFKAFLSAIALANHLSARETHFTKVIPAKKAVTSFFLFLL
jgi:hypothetical protein